MASPSPTSHRSLCLLHLAALALLYPASAQQATATKARATEARAVISTSAAPAAPTASHASQGVQLLSSGGLLTSLQYGVNAATGQLVSGGSGPETLQALKNIGAVFAKAGLQLDGNGTRCLLYVSDLETNFFNASDAYKTVFTQMPHPTRSPFGVRLALPQASVALHCSGSASARQRIAPPNFFASDFNSQGILTDDVLYTAGQIGADPVSGAMVPGGATNETHQALSNLQVVFASAFPSISPPSSALSARASHCSLLVANVSKTWPLVEAQLSAFFPDPKSRPAFSVSGVDPGFGASIEAYCSGAPLTAQRSAIQGAPNAPAPFAGDTQGIVVRTRDQIFVQAAAQAGISPSTGKLVSGGAGAETTQALRNLNAVFNAALFGGLSTLGQTATQCHLLVLAGSASAPSDAVAAVQQAQASFGLYFSSFSVTPTLVTLLVAGLPVPGSRVSVRCDGATNVNLPSDVLS